MAQKLIPKQIEYAGVDAVSDYFNFSETLDPSIPKEDKGATWDGKLNLYRKGDKERKNNMIGFILTQVKGKSSEDFSKVSIKYPVNVDDIRIYLHNNGIAYFVVYVSPKTKQKKIYYKLLAPIELRQIAKAAGNKKSVSLDFEELPELSDKIEFLFRDFYYDCLKQHSFCDQEPIHLQDIKSEIRHVGFQFTVPSNDAFEAMKYLTTSPQFCYATLRNDPTNTPHPLGEGRFSFTARRKANLSVTIGDKMYFDEVDYEIVNGKTYFVIGDCLRVPFSQSPERIGKSEKTQLDLNFKTLSQRIKSLSFIKAAKEAGSFKIGKSIATINGNTSKVDEQIERMLEADLNLQFVFKHLHVTEDLIISEINEQDVKNMNTLIDYFVLGNKVQSSVLVDHQFVRIDISNIKLLFLAERIGETDNYDLYSIHDLEKFMFSLKNYKAQIVLAPSFFAFSIDTFKDVSNINYENFIDECNSLKSNDQVFYYYLNATVLKMINAYDQQTNKKQMLIDTALSLSEWLITNDPDKSVDFVYIINRLQILARLRNLTNEEKQVLFKFTDEPKYSDEIKFTCYTLLGAKSIANRFFRKMSNEKQEFYKTLPIYFLFDKTIPPA